jgi:hypothetical protein
MSPVLLYAPISHSRRHAGGKLRAPRVDWQKTLFAGWHSSLSVDEKSGTVLSLQQTDCHNIEHLSAIRDVQLVSTKRLPSAHLPKGLSAVFCNSCCFIVRTMVVIAVPNCC